MPRVEYGGDAFPPGDKEIWDEWYEGRDGKTEGVAQLETTEEEERVRQFMALPLEDRRRILVEHYREHPEALDSVIDTALENLPPADISEN